VDFSKLSREDWLVGGGGILLIIFLFALPWFHESVAGFSASQAATSSPYAIWGILALIVLLAVVIDWGLATFSPQTTVPTTQLGRELTRAAAAGLVLLLLIIKLIAHTGNWGFGFYIDIIFAIGVLYGAWSIAQGKSTAVKAS
jgi:cytochrome b561